MITYADLAQEVITRWPAVDQRRIDRALNILATESVMRARKSEDGCDLEPSNAVWAVKQSHRSAHPDDQWYIVRPEAKSCTCPDSQTGHICKHRIAVWMYLELPKRYSLEAQSRKSRVYEAQEINLTIGA
jgi:hypothetical protein